MAILHNSFNLHAVSMGGYHPLHPVTLTAFLPPGREYDHSCLFVCSPPPKMIAEDVVTIIYILNPVNLDVLVLHHDN